MSFRAIFKLIRIPNLFMMALTLYSCRYFLIIPILKFSGSDSLISHFNFFLITVSILFIAAGGYVINDYYDVEIDGINKPEKIVIGKLISPEKAYLLFHTLCFSGILVAFYLGFFTSIPFIGFIHTGCVVLLWIYARYLKRTVLLGNIVVSLLCAFTILLVTYYDQSAREASPIQILMVGYASFAFIISLIREIIKDLEDLKGDMAGGCKTLPVVAGPRFSIRLASVLIVATLALLSGVGYLQYQSKDIISLFYIAVALQAPLLYLVFRLLKSKTIHDLKFCSKMCKIIMLTGILSMFIFYLEFR